MLKVKCPTCGTETRYEGNEHRPFCSERCKLIDFGAWANEEYSLPVEETSLTEEDLARIEQVTRERNDDDASV